MAAGFCLMVGFEPAFALYRRPSGTAEPFGCRRSRTGTELAYTCMGLSDRRSAQSVNSAEWRYRYLAGSAKWNAAARNKIRFISFDPTVVWLLWLPLTRPER
jgi:hypothetical protein